MFGLSHQPERLDGSKVWLIHLNKIILQPFTFLIGRGKYMKHPVDLGEVHLFPDITKWAMGFCCRLSFGRESKWRLVSQEQIHSLATKRKRWGFSFAPDKYSWDTKKASQCCLASTHTLYCTPMEKFWAECSALKKYFQEHLVWKE